MINNRQGGRRRGRGGGGRAPNNVPSGNRQDNRQRGNAAQLLEKYKQLARDAQLGGDRVQSEYYLQFAEHYFRVLNENRARFEDQRPRRDDDYDDEDGDDDMVAADGDDGAQEEEQSQQRPQREHREVRHARDNRDTRDSRETRDSRDTREVREPREAREGREPREGRDGPDGRGDGDQRNGEARYASRTRRPRRDLNGDGPAHEQPAANGQDDARIALDSLPPAIAATTVGPAGDGDDDAPRPRRRTRRPRTDETGDSAPAAA